PAPSRHAARERIARGIAPRLAALDRIARSSEWATTACAGLIAMPAAWVFSTGLGVPRPVAPGRPKRVRPLAQRGWAVGDWMQLAAYRPSSARSSRSARHQLSISLPPWPEA